MEETTRRTGQAIMHIWKTNLLHETMMEMLKPFECMWKYNIWSLLKRRWKVNVLPISHLVLLWHPGVETYVMRETRDNGINTTWKVHEGTEGYSELSKTAVSSSQMNDIYQKSIQRLFWSLLSFEETKRRGEINLREVRGSWPKGCITASVAGTLVNAWIRSWGKRSWTLFFYHILSEGKIFILKSWRCGRSASFRICHRQVC